MYEVFLWVPTKGWKKVLGTKSLRKAVETALSFTPLEVKICGGPNYQLWFSGRCHVPMEHDPGLAQIEDLLKAVEFVDATNESTNSV